MRLTTIIATACLLGAVAPAWAGDAATQRGEWQRVSDADGIIVYQKDLEGSDIISLRGEAIIDATVDDIFDVMKNNAEAHEWMPLVVEKRNLRVMSDHMRIEYTHVGMPWPITDRYFINSGTAQKLSNGGMKIFIKSVEHPNYLEDDKVLGDLKYSEFLLTPIDGGYRTRLTLEVNTDPRGMIPKWLVNMAQKSWPRDFMTGLRKQLAKKGKLGTTSFVH